MLSYDFTVNGAVENVIHIPYDEPAGTLVGHLFVSPRSDTQGTEIANAITFDKPNNLIVVDIPASAATSTNFPGFYTITLSVDGSPGATVMTGRVGFVPAITPPVTYLTQTVADTLYSTRFFGGKDKINTVSGAQGAVTLDLSNGNIHSLTMTGNVTLFIQGAVANTAAVVTLILKQDGVGGRTITWPPGTKWSSGQAPTLSTGGNKVDVITLISVDGGGTWNGFPSGSDMG